MNAASKTPLSAEVKDGGGIWGYGGAGVRTVDSHVQALRRKLGPQLVRTVHGVGYALGVE